VRYQFGTDFEGLPYALADSADFAACVNGEPLPVRPIWGRIPPEVDDSKAEISSVFSEWVPEDVVEFHNDLRDSLRSAEWAIDFVEEVEIEIHAAAEYWASFGRAENVYWAYKAAAAEAFAVVINSEVNDRATRSQRQRYERCCRHYGVAVAGLLGALVPTVRAKPNPSYLDYVRGLDPAFGARRRAGVPQKLSPEK